MSLLLGLEYQGYIVHTHYQKQNRVLLIDERDYVGGRIYTHPMNYEVGAARYNSSHKRLLKLIKTHGLEGVKLLKRVDYVEVSNDSIKKTDKSHIQFDNLLKHVLQHTTVSQNLRKKSFYDHISSLVSQSVADKIVNMFGYYSEIKAMNAYDAYMTFKNDFGNIQYYRLKNGFSELCNVMAQTIKSQKSDIILQSKVVDVRKHSDTTYIVETCKNSFRGRKIIFCNKTSSTQNVSNFERYS